jgi:nucleotide-binding universal stress UspA family protein
MQHTIDRPRGMRGSGHAMARGGRGHGRAGVVLLATFDSAPFHPDAARFAVDTALECGRVLVDVNAVDHIRDGHFVHRDTPLDPPEVAAALRAPAELAAGLGVRVERFLLHSPRPLGGLLGLIAARNPALVVFGPDPAALGRFLRPTRRRYQRFLRVLERDVPCLLWTPQEPLADAVSSPDRPSSRARPAPMRRASPGSATTIASPTSSHAPTTNGKRSYGNT